MPELNPTPAPARGILCPACGRSKDCTTSQLARFSRRGLPWCCGAIMKVHGGPETASSPAIPTEKRLGHRRMAMPGAMAEFRRGALGLGPDLAVTLMDVSEDGVCVHLREPVAPGEDAEVMLSRPLGGKPLKRRATILWCRPAWGRGNLVEVLFARRLSHAELSTLAQ